MTQAAGKAKARPGTRTVRFRIKRCEGPEQASRWEVFDVPVASSSEGSGSANVISCLQWINEHPRTADGEETTPVTYDSGCLEEVCGSCTVLINGRVRQACSCLIDEYAPNDGDEITLEPLTKFPIYRDLFVDRSRLFEDLKRVRGWVPIDGTHDLGPGPRETPEEQQLRYKLSQCMSCACCLEACPQYQYEEERTGKGFVGAAVISQGHYFNMHETGKRLARERLEELTGPGGIQDCGNSQNCVKVCPKEIPLTQSIARVGRSTTFYRIGKFFAGK